MYIWIGAKLPEEFAEYIRKLCVPMSEVLGLDISGFSLPQHISLKISFPTDTPEEVLAFLEERLRRERVFYVNPRVPERKGNVLWIPFRPNAPLRHYHNMLDRNLAESYGITQHEFDKSFLYHSTLFLGEGDSLVKAEQLLQQLPLPTQLEIDTILLGVSESGRSGEYRVVAEIPLMKQVRGA